MLERRHCSRKRVDLFFNRFLDGYPYLCRAVDLSSGGVSVETYSEPVSEMESFPLELRLPGEQETLWLWARRARREPNGEALEFVSMSEPARARLERFVTNQAPLAA